MFIKKKNFTLSRPAEINELFRFKNTVFGLITAKLIDTSIYRKALELMGEDIKIRMNWFDDNIIMAIIYSLTSSFKYINKYGYLAYRQRDSSSRKGTKTLCYDSLIYIFLLYNE